MALLEIEDLQVRYRTGAGEARAVDGVSCAIETGMCLGLVGESGCGKSTVAKAVLGILPPAGRVAGGAIRYEGRDLVGMTPRELRRIRWQHIALVPQSAMNGLDPVYTVERQLAEAITAHRSMPAAQRRHRIAELFALVGLEAGRVRDYPHQFSGGMRQRAMIAMAMVLDPPLIVADEPTTGLDVLMQDQILQQIRLLHERLGKAMLLITHDMAVVAENCDRIAVMYAGRIMEYGGEAVFRTPYHPYTLGLCNAFPDMADRGRALISIPGTPPDLVSPPDGCRFHARCPFATALCATMEPPLVEVAAGHVVACHYIEQADGFRARAADPATWQERVPS
ncbi:MAG TPA: ABC transporter ATP-binding protein [Acetobacteraceae bacterium]|jgi:oligopeptide/dipeptide ABC transporter ATP-binding protein|nr:ABC transporter ATP-binding protein [Acetobacteraceae bacterium]